MEKIVMVLKTAIVFVNCSVVEFRSFKNEKFLIKYIQRMFDKYENPTVEIWQCGKPINRFG